MPYFLQHFSKNWVKTLVHGTLQKKLLISRRSTSFDMLVYWSISLKIDGDLYFLKGDRPSSGNVNMGKIYERLLSTIKLRENRRDSFDPQRENLLDEDSI